MNMNRISAPIRACVRRHVRQAFTLIELMISIALAALIMAGIHFIFSTTSRTAGMAHGLVSVVANARAAEPVMRQDLHGAAMDGPFFMIRSGRTFAFLNRDEEVAAGGNPAMKRPYRTDMLMFFARGRFPRQTGNDGQYVAPMSSDEAYIWYGHGRRPNLGQPTGTLQKWTHYLPGQGTFADNPNNYYAKDWVLSRVVMLLREPDPITGNVLSDAGQPQACIQRSPTAQADSLAPFSLNSQSTGPNVYMVQWSRYDLAATSIAGYRAILNNAILLNAPATPWWSHNHFNFRFQCNPTPTKPLDSFGMARTVPCFLLGCVSFAVEFAGDFLSQDPVSGAVMADLPDGQIDFIRENLGGGEVANRVRWYGLPRDVDGDGVIDWRDVVPVRDLTTTLTPLGFERVGPVYQADYNSPPPPPDTPYIYIVAWGPDTAALPRPAMIRVVLSVDDPDGRLADSQSYEYVFALP